MVPGDHPKVQVKLALPDDYDQFSVHPMTLRATKETTNFEQIVNEEIDPDALLKEIM